MIASVVSAGAVLWFLFSESAGAGFPGTDDAGANDSIVNTTPNFNLYFLGMISMVALVVMFVRRKLQEELDMQTRCVFVLVAWVAAEGIGLFGAARAIKMTFSICAAIC